MKEAIFFCIVGLSRFGKEGSGTPVFIQNPSESYVLFCNCCMNNSHELNRDLMLWLFVGPTGVYLLDLFCSSIQFYLLLSP